MNTGKAIKVAMAMRSIQQKDLAVMIGVNDSTMSTMCRGSHASTRTMERIANVLGMKTSELVALGEDK